MNDFDPQPEHDDAIDDEATKRINQGQEAKRLLQEPIIERFFKDQESRCFETFEQLPIDSTINEYRTVHHALLASKQLRLTLQTYIQRAEMDVLERKRQDDLPEDIEI